MTYNGPAGIVLSKADVELIHRHLLCDNTPEARELRARIEEFQNSVWQDVAARRAAAIESCTPLSNS